MGLGMIGCAKAFNDLKPDLCIVLGDRFEIFSAVSAAMIAKIPMAHLHGGEATEGVIDEPIRHSITKMSHLHFVAAKEYKNRVIQLGEQPNRVFNVGGLGIDNINKLKLLSRGSFEQAINFSLGEKNILVTFHPVTLESSTAEIQFKELLDALDDLEDTKIIFTKANSDTDGRVINSMIDDYVTNHDNTISFTSMGQLNYLSALQFVDAVVGNSSSGLLEAPSFKIGTIDIGDRQKGRIKADSVINCSPEKEDISKSLGGLYSKDFQNIVKNTKNPYGSGGASKKIISIIRDINLKGVLKKTFYDLMSVSK
jgi:GDP/UDP-N,N'-diacetylbacillosamine 2-epimerase (hydrolysing)